MTSCYTNYIQKIIHMFNLANTFHVLLPHIYMSLIPIWNKWQSMAIQQPSLYLNNWNFLVANLLLVIFSIFSIWMPVLCCLKFALKFCRLNFSISIHVFTETGLVTSVSVFCVGKLKIFFQRNLEQMKNLQICQGQEYWKKLRK